MLTWLLVKWNICSSHLFFLITSEILSLSLRLCSFTRMSLDFFFYIHQDLLFFLTMMIALQQFWEILSQYSLKYLCKDVLCLHLTETAMLVSLAWGHFMIISQFPDSQITVYDINSTYNLPKEGCDDKSQRRYFPHCTKPRPRVKTLSWLLVQVGNFFLLFSFLGFCSSIVWLYMSTEV